MSVRKISKWQIVEEGSFWPGGRFFYKHTGLTRGSEGYRRAETDSIKLDLAEYQRAKQEIEESGGARIGQQGSLALWWAEDGLYWADANLADEDVLLLIWDRLRKQNRKLDRLRKLRHSQEQLDELRRERIADEVRALVWERDEGRCVKCGTEEELQFDHIIPVARGGGNTAENIQILCGGCNRQKGDQII